MTVASEDIRGRSFHEAVQGFKKELVRSALRMHSGNRLRAAVELGISRAYLHRLLNHFSLSEEQGAPKELDEDETTVRDFQIHQSPAKRPTARIA